MAQPEERKPKLRSDQRERKQGPLSTGQEAHRKFIHLPASVALLPPLPPLPPLSPCEKGNELSWLTNIDSLWKSRGNRRNVTVSE